jgi:hypothetical protein
VSSTEYDEHDERSFRAAKAVGSRASIVHSSATALHDETVAGRTRGVSAARGGNDVSSEDPRRARPRLPDLDALLDDVDAGRGARDTVVIPVPTVTARAVPEVRSTVRDVVERALHPADPHELQLVCSELVSNAVMHGEPPVELLFHEGADEMIVAVYDEGRGQPVAGESSTSGLHIVAEVTGGRWGVTPRGRGKWVWAALPRKEARPGMP